MSLEDELRELKRQYETARMYRVRFDLSNAVYECMETPRTDRMIRENEVRISKCDVCMHRLSNEILRVECEIKRCEEDAKTRHAKLKRKRAIKAAYDKGFRDALRGVHKLT